MSDPLVTITNEVLSKKLDELLLATIDKTLEGIREGDKKALEIALKILTDHKRIIHKATEIITSGNPDSLLETEEDNPRALLPSNRRNR